MIKGTSSNIKELTEKEVKFLKRMDNFYKHSTWLIYYWGGLSIIMFVIVIYLYFKNIRNDLLNISIGATLVLLIAFRYTLNLRKFIQIINKLENQKIIKTS